MEVVQDSEAKENRKTSQIPQVTLHLPKRSEILYSPIPEQHQNLVFSDQFKDK